MTHEITKIDTKQDSQLNKVLTTKINCKTVLLNQETNNNNLPKVKENMSIGLVKSPNHSMFK